MKKCIAVVLSWVCILTLSACGVSGNADENVGGTTAAAGFPITGEISGEITISAYDTMTYKAFLDDAARLFEAKYPGTTVKLETFSAMPEMKTSDQDGENMMIVAFQDDPQDKQDYINQVNTAFMSGGGADILAMDVLPFNKYAASGQLEDLGAYMQADTSFHKTEYRANILDAVVCMGGTWFLPMDYTFDYYTYDSTLLTGSTISGFSTDARFTAEELIALAEPYIDGKAMLFNRPDYARGPRDDMWRLLLDESYATFADVESKKASFNDGRFAALLESVKRYGDLGYIPQGSAGQSDPETMMRQSREGATDPYFFKPQTAVNLISLFTRDLDMALGAMAEGSTMVVGDNDEIAGIAAGTNGSVPFTYGQAYGINANSTNKATAWAFLCFLLSEEMQLHTNLSPTTLPLSNTARAKKMETMLTEMLRQQGQTFNESQREAIVKYNETVEQLSDQIDTYVIKDTVVDYMIAAEVQHFFEGTKTSAEAADILQSKVNLYMNE